MEGGGEGGSEKKKCRWEGEEERKGEGRDGEREKEKGRREGERGNSHIVTDPLLSYLLVFSDLLLKVDIQVL